MTIEQAGQSCVDAAKIILKSLEEIRIHKWIESQKTGRDVGGNTAALDWLNHYYDGWLKGNFNLKGC